MVVLMPIDKVMTEHRDNLVELDKHRERLGLPSCTLEMYFDHYDTLPSYIGKIKDKDYTVLMIEKYNQSYKSVEDQLVMEELRQMLLGLDGNYLG